jgi:hypothetical protein
VWSWCDTANPFKHLLFSLKTAWKKLVKKNMLKHINEGEVCGKGTSTKVVQITPLQLKRIYTYLETFIELISKEKRPLTFAGQPPKKASPGTRVPRDSADFACGARFGPLGRRPCVPKLRGVRDGQLVCRVFFSFFHLGLLLFFDEFSVRFDFSLNLLCTLIQRRFPVTMFGHWMVEGPLFKTAVEKKDQLRRRGPFFVYDGQRGMVGCESSRMAKLCGGRGEVNRTR